MEAYKTFLATTSDSSRDIPKLDLQTSKSGRRNMGEKQLEKKKGKDVTVDSDKKKTHLSLLP